MDSDSGGSPIVVDLFCGAGGLSNGLTQAGFRPILGIDFDKVATATYRANHPEALTMQRDIATVKSSEIQAVAGSRNIDLIAGGPSCQAYSTVGKRIEDDPPNFLFKHFVRLVSDLQPKFFLMENVKGLLTFRNGYFRHLIEGSFTKAGYSVISKVGPNTTSESFALRKARNACIPRTCPLCLMAIRVWSKSTSDSSQQTGRALQLSRRPS